jgi:hypothetical protein
MGFGPPRKLLSKRTNRLFAGIAFSARHSLKKAIFEIEHVRSTPMLHVCVWLLYAHISSYYQQKCNYAYISWLATLIPRNLYCHAAS